MRSSGQLLNIITSQHMLLARYLLTENTLTTAQYHTLHITHFAVTNMCDFLFFLLSNFKCFLVIVFFLSFSLHFVKLHLTFGFWHYIK